MEPEQLVDVEPLTVQQLEEQMEETKQDIENYIDRIQKFIDELCVRIGIVTEQPIPSSAPISGDNPDVISRLRKENDELRRIINGNNDKLNEIREKLLNLKKCGGKDNILTQTTGPILEESGSSEEENVLQPTSSGSLVGSLGTQEPISPELQGNVRSLIDELESRNEPGTPRGGNKRRKTKKRKTKRKKLKKKRSTKK